MPKNDTYKFSGTDLERNLKYLRLLSDKFPTIQKASTEVINLSAILNLPKGTEHFLTDIHGEYETFSHVLANASGVVKRKIEDVFGKTLRKKEKNLLAALIYYPKEKLELVLKNEDDTKEWFAITLQRLIKVARASASKYTRSKVRKAMPDDFAYIIDELLNESGEDKEDYFDGIINTIISIDRAEAFIVAICNFIQTLLIDRLHIIGDIFDRGPSAEKVMDRLIAHHAVDIQWGNHDIIWMGAASGNLASIANVIRISLRYNNIDTLEDAYGITMMPLATFAMNNYKNDPCNCFVPKAKTDVSQFELIKQMHKAISIIQFKLEGQIIKRNPNFNMDERLLLDKINYKKGIIEIDGRTYDLIDKYFPTVDREDPYKLSREELEVMEKLSSSFKNSKRLQSHVEFLFANGSMYLTYNSNLLYHGCVPMTKDGEFQAFEIDGNKYSGKELCDRFDRAVRSAFQNRYKKRSDNQYLDYGWYLWCGAVSPLFGKQKMTTFERYFIDNKDVQKEERNPYYKYAYESEEVCDKILEEFNLDAKNSHIVNGHVPVKVKKGESPIKANGKLFVIDGGMSIPYQKVTGVSGYTLIFNSYGLVLVEHKEFGSKQEAIEHEKDIISDRIFIERNAKRKRVSHTDVGKVLESQINDLKMLLAAFRDGLIKERI
jgi:fructose-1,6-bisphosphatase-3